MLISPPYTANTHTSTASLRRDLEEIRERGYAVGDEEYRENLRCIAFPIRDHAGAVVASIGVSGLASILKREGVPVLAEVVATKADGISWALGFV